MKTVKAKVRTKSGKSEILYDKEKNIYLVSVKAQPEQGKANQEVLKLFRRMFKKDIEIISGKTSKEKLIRIG